MAKVEIEDTELDALKTDAAAKAALTSEIQKARGEKTDAEAARDLALAQLEDEKKKGNQPPTDATAEAAVRKVLAEEGEKTAKDNLLAAEAKFKNTYKEFHPDNDAGGVKYAAFKQTLARFSFNGLKSQDDFLARFDDAYKLMNPGSTETNKFTPPAHTPSGGGTGPNARTESQLSSKEQKLIQQMGWDEARYLKQKTARPRYVESLLNLLP